jgi:type IV pilus assembly protein PilE
MNRGRYVDTRQINRSGTVVITVCRGFTLIELMMVVVVVAILAAVAYPSYQEAVRKAKRAEGRAALMELMQQQERYYSQKNTYIEFSSTSTDANEKRFKWHSGDSPQSSAYEIYGAACADDISNCVILTARPGTDKVSRYVDNKCGELTLSSTGKKTAVGNDCW